MLGIREGVKLQRDCLNESTNFVQWHHQNDSYEICGPKLVCGELDLTGEKRTLSPTLPTGVSRGTLGQAYDPQQIK